MGRTRLALALAALLGGGCQSEPSGPVSLPLADAASMRLYTVQATPQDWTGHIALTEGHTVRLMVRIYTASGREIIPPEHPVTMSFSMAPDTLATASVADSALLLFDITPTAPPDADGSLFVTLTEPSTATSKSFGPFFVLVHAAQ